MSSVFILGVAALLLLASAGGLTMMTFADQRRAAQSARLRALLPAVRTVDIGGGLESATRAKTSIDFLPPMLRQRLRTSLERTGNSISPTRLLLNALFGAALAIGISIFMEFSLRIEVALVLALSLLAPTLALQSARKRHVTKFLDLFPDAIEMIVRAVRAGLPVVAALEAVGREIDDPIGGEFRAIVAQLQIGRDTDEALRRAAQRIGIADFSFFVASLLLQRESGGNLSEALSNLAHVLRKRKELRMKTKAITSEARTSAMVIGALPFVAGGGLAALNPAYIGVLFHDPRGHKLLAIGGAALTMAAFTMRLLIQRALR